jgi:serine-type D-Ala-D-Ala carboxypeptidase/endopeptidase (penicillin-binding protein 4)
MFNIQFRFAYIVLLTSYIFLASCGVTKQISKSAEQSVINDSSLVNAHIGISIYEPESGKYWYNYNGEKYFVPASNTKIPTCYAAMKYLGDSLVGLRYDVMKDSVLIIEPSGDPTFLLSEFNNQRVFDLLKKFSKVEIYPDVEGITPTYGNGWSWNDYLETYMAYPSVFPIYGNIASFKLVGDSIVVTPSRLNDSYTRYKSKSIKTFEVRRRFPSNEFWSFAGKKTEQQIPFYPDFLQVVKMLSDTIKREAKFVALNFWTNVNFKKLHSQPTDSLLKPMMHRSDNFFAEQSLLMVSNERLGVMNDEKIIDTLLKSDFKDLPQKPRWVDGSGLSRYNLFTPQDFVAILGKIEKEFGMNRIKEIFPTGGEGTISSYYKSDSGFIYAKTGTLSGVVALSGFLTTKKGKQLLFSVLVNNHNGSATAVRRAV